MRAFRTFVADGRVRLFLCRPYGTLVNKCVSVGARFSHMRRRFAWGVLVVVGLSRQSWQV